MKLLLGIAIVVALGACGDDSPYVQDAGDDTGAFTAFVIDLVNNHTDDPAPASFDAFKDLADPDGDNNNVTAYDGLFQ